MPELNFPVFNAEAARLRALGFEVVNPADLNPVPDTGWHECMRNDLKALLDCDALALLDGWQRSAGAHLEMHVAHRVGMEIVIAREVKRLRILLDREDGTRTQLGTVIDRIRSRSRKVRSLYLVATKSGVPLNQHTLRIRFDAARNDAIEELTGQGNGELAARVRQFQFRDIRPKAASEIGDVMAASKLLGHTEQEITKKVYIRVGETVKPTR